MMRNDIQNDIVNAIISETISSIPRDIFSFYMKLPGRSPSEISKRISILISNMNEEIALEFIQDIVDSTVFTILYLIDNDFKDQKIETIFLDRSATPGYNQLSLLEIYRSEVDPGGKIIVGPI